MKLTPADVRLLAATVDLEIPDKDLDNVTLRLSALLASMAQMEQELGEAMDAVEPLPPVHLPDEAD
jgi:hypothetical protein